MIFDKLFTCTLLFLLTATCCSSQSNLIYLYSSDSEPSQGVIYQVDEENTGSLYVTLEESAPVFSDIAVNLAGDLYGITIYGDIWLIDENDGSSEFIVSLVSVGAVTSLVCDINNVLFTIAGFDLLSYDLNTGIAETIFSMNDGTPGDICFLNGHLVFPSSSEPNKLKSIDLATNQIHTVYCFPEEITNFSSIWGISNKFDACGNELLIVGNSLNNYFEIDVYAQSYEYVDYSIELPDFETYGMAGMGDVNASECNGIVSPVDCTVGFADVITDPNIVHFYPNPVIQEINFPTAFRIENAQILELGGKSVKFFSRPNSSVSVEDIVSGIYLLKIQYRDGSEAFSKIVIQ